MVVKKESKSKKTTTIKTSASKKVSLDELEEEIDDIEKNVSNSGESTEEGVLIKASKPIGALKKGDRVFIDDKECTVDAQYVLIDHGSTQEMALEIFDPKTDIDYQLRYFSDQMETTLELYQLQEIMYIKKPLSKISW